MSPDEIFECIAQALTNALDRDAASGWGAMVHIIEADKITTKKIKTRMAQRAADYESQVQREIWENFSQVFLQLFYCCAPATFHE